MPRISNWSRDRLSEVLAAQRNVVTAAQLAEIGVPRSTVAFRNGVGGMFTWILPGIHLVGSRVPDSDQRDLAALLYAGERAALTGTSSLARYGIKAMSSPWSSNSKVHVLVPATRRRMSHGFVTVERTIVPYESGRHDGLALASVARSVVDASRRCSESRKVRALVAEVVQRGLASPNDLKSELDQAQIRGSAYVRSAITEVVAGVQSVPEADLRQGFIRRSLPEPLWNPTVRFPDGSFLCRPDAYIEEVAVAAEVDSREYHFSPEDWQATMERHAAMTAAGIITLHFTPRAIRENVDVVIDQILATVRNARGRKLPNLRVFPLVHE